MDRRLRPAIEVPEGPVEPRPAHRWEPMACWGRSPFAPDDGNNRDVSKPVAFDGLGRPLYAPRGLTVRVR